MRNINKIIIHCSDSDWGDAPEIDRWHKERGWDSIGYHYVITNGRLESSSTYTEDDDGIVQEGRNVEISGAHAKGYNSTSVGICLIGKHHFTGRQLYRGLPTIVDLLLNKYKLTPDSVFGHTELDPHKTCPNFEVINFRALLRLGGNNDIRG